jgi:hypothetical protein
MSSESERHEGGGASRSTDPASGTSSATDVSLREFLMAAIQSARAECKEGIAHLEQSVAASEKASKDAIDKALASIDKRFDGVNEFRNALGDLGKTMATKTDVANLADKVVAADEALESRFESLYQRNRGDIDLINRRLDMRQGSDEGSRLTKGSLYAVIAAAVAVSGLLVVVATYLSSH